MILALDAGQIGLLGTGVGAFLTALFGGYAAWSANKKTKTEESNSVAVKRVDQALNALGETVDTLREEVRRCAEREVDYIAQLGAERVEKARIEREKAEVARQLQELRTRLDRLEKPE